MFIIFFGKVVLAIFRIVSAKIAAKDTCLYDMIWYLTVVYYTLNTALFVWFHFERWSHSGRVCSGDFLSEEDYNRYRDYWKELPDN